MMSYEHFFEMQSYVRFSEADSQQLLKLLPLVRPHLADIAQEFYERVLDHPEAARVFKDEAQVRRLQITLQRWVSELLEGPHDRRYFENRARISESHVRVGVAQRYVCSAMTLVRLRLVEISQHAFTDVIERTQVVTALHKAIDIDQAIMLETYREAMLDRVRHVEELQRAGIARRLAAAEQRYRDTIEGTEALVIVLDDEGRTLLWNRAASKLTGYELDELMGKKPLDFLILDDEERVRVLAAGPGLPSSAESALVTRSGRERFIRWFSSVTTDPETERPMRHLIGVDLTEAREAEQRARQTERLAAVGTMAAGLAHEIRNPLNAASLHVSLLERALSRMESVPDAAREASGVLKDELKRLSRLVSDFLDFARPRPLRPTPQMLCEICTSVIELMKPDAEAAGVRLHFERPPREVWASIDGERIRQVLINLVRNAIEAERDARGGEVVVRVRKVGRIAEIDVHDDGPGVPPDAPVFDAFFTTKENGTGLGLSIVHRIVDDHGGSVRLHSVPGDTVFTMRLPGALEREEAARLSDGNDG